MLTRLKQLSKHLLAPAIALSALGAVIALQNSALEAAKRNTALSEEEYFRQERVEGLTLVFLQQMPALGFDSLLADWAFLQAIQYFGDTPARNQTGYSLLPEHLELIVERDPRFVTAYLRLSTPISLFAGRPERTVALIEQGLPYLTPKIDPNVYFVWLYKGVDEVLFLGDLQSAQHSYKMAARWASLQDTPFSQTIAARAREMAQFVAQNPDSKRVQAAAWATILSNTKDQRTRQEAIKRIEALGGEVTMTSQGGAVSIRVQLPEESTSGNN